MDTDCVTVELNELEVQTLKKVVSFFWDSQADDPDGAEICGVILGLLDKSGIDHGFPIY